MTRFYHSYISPLRSFTEYILKVFPLLFLTGILFLLSSCEENASKIGYSLLPGSDFVAIKSTDTIKVKSYTMYSDSVESDNPLTSYLGQLYDPYFGKTTAELVCQLRLMDSLNDLNFIVIDSITLNLKLLTVKGSVDKQHYLRLSEIAKQIYTDSLYYSDQIPPLTGYKVDDILLPKLRTDTINDIKLNIPTSFGDYLTRGDRSMLFMSDTRADFRSWFKGLYFQIISPDDPIFVSLSVASPGSTGTYSNYFTLYYHNEYGTSSSYLFLLDATNTNAAYNIYKHDFTAGEAGKKIPHINDKYLDTLSYAQIMYGVYTRFEIPGLADLKKDANLKDIAVNKARLILPVFYDGDIYKPSTIPSLLYLRYLTSTGHKYYVSDYSTISSTFYDGTPDTTKTNSYKINIASYLQQYLKDTKDTIKPELELFLLPTSSYNVILRANKSYKPVKFEFTYTKF